MKGIHNLLQFVYTNSPISALLPALADRISAGTLGSGPFMWLGVLSPRPKQPQCASL